jgi:acetyl esterase/lipase
VSPPAERHAYGEHPSQLCELFLPTGAEPFRVAVLIHGGFWRDRYGRDLEWPLAADLVERGWAAWNVEYRRLGGGGGFPETLEDVAAAIDALAEVDAPLDLGRVVAIGHSAGGQLALWAAARAGARVPLTAAVSQAGALDLDELYRLGTSDGVVGDLLGGGPEDVLDRYRAASPARRLPIGVPLLLVHGELDDDVPAGMSRAFAAAAREAGDECDLVVVEDEGHYEHLQPGSQVWAAVVKWLS